MQAAALASILLCFCGASQAFAWEAHDRVTRLALQSYENLDEFAFEPIAEALPALSAKPGTAPATTTQLSEQLGINGAKIDWEWKPKSSEGDSVSAAVETIAFSSLEADAGMDQDLDVSDDQKYMGGTKGPSSQGFRHMYYRRFSPAEPLATFHFPFREMGEAPRRARIFFDLAVQAKKAGHLFWAYRFLGWGVHYVQDLGQPYHANQLGSPTLFPLWELITRGFEAAVAEATRLSGNFHLSFERYADYFLGMNGENNIVLAFKAPKGNAELRAALQQNLDLSIEEGTKRLAEASSRLAGSLVSAQNQLMGPLLKARETDLISGFYDAQGRAKVDFAAYETDASVADQRKITHEAMFDALSNTGIATRWYVDRFKMAK